MARTLTCLAGIVLLTASLNAQLVVDPNGGGDFTDLQAAITAAPPASVIRVVGGTYGPVTVDRSLTIIGDPRPHITAPPGSSGGPFQPPAVLLSGSGEEALTLVNLRIGDGFVSELLGHAVAGHAIDGVGFARLHVQDCVVRGPEWTSLDGIKPGASAIRLVAATGITLVRSDVGASMSVTSEVTNVFPPDGVPGIDAPGADVVVLSSTVSGGSVNETIIDSIPPLPNPCPCLDETGHGGPGIVAEGVTAVASLIEGGQGSEVTHYGSPWGQQLAGEPILADRIDSFAETLIAVEAPEIGSDYQLAFAPPPASAALLVLGTPDEAPWIAKGALLHIDPSDLLVLFPIAPGQSLATYAIPLDAALIGVRFGLQLAENNVELTLSNPVIDAFVD